ncbi:MAG TPA: hypothetical protein VFV92_01230, partial [Candidatus Bathyarchaeia archaeon]|nr:hypothetical protein [Candidatus Bathyarchaeia archaeon]
NKISIVGNYKLRLLLRTVDLMMRISHHSDWSSLLLFASKNPVDFPSTEVAALGTDIVESSFG